YVVAILLVTSPLQVAVPLPGNGVAPLNVVPIDYVVSAASHIHDDERAVGRTFHLADPNPSSSRRIYELIAERQGKKLPRLSLGHANARVREAVLEQTRLLWHASNLYVTEPQVRLAEKLVRHSKTLKRVFFCNSGAEANEAAIKLARHHHYVNGHPERIEIV